MSEGQRIRSNTSDVEVCPEKGVVRKTVRDYLLHGVLDREAFWLEELDASPRFPSLVDLSGNTLTMTYAGERVTQSTLPADWREQSELILSQLTAFNCRHNDIKPEDILVLDGRLMLVDFGWATRAWDSVPDTWPSRLGEPYKKPGSFSDRYSMNLSLETVARGKG